MLKSLDPIIAKFYEHGENNRFDSCVFTNNQYSRFFFNYTHIKLKKKHVNSKPKVLSNTIFGISRFLTTDIHRTCTTDRFVQ